MRQAIIVAVTLIVLAAQATALTRSEQFTTYLNVTKNDSAVEVFSEIGKMDIWTCNGTITGNSYTNYPVVIRRDVTVEDPVYTNMTDMMFNLLKSAQSIATFGNDSRSFYDKYVDSEAARERVVANYDMCKEQRDEYKTKADKYTEIESNLNLCNSQKNEYNSRMVKCEDTDLPESKSSGQTNLLIGGVIGAILGYIVSMKFPFKPSEQKQFG